MRKIKRSDLTIGSVLHYQDPRNEGFAGIVAGSFVGFNSGRTLYNIRQRQPSGTCLSSVEYSLPAINRIFKLPETQ